MTSLAKITPVDAPKSILAAILLGTVGVLSFIVQPGLVQGYVTELGLSEAAANDLAFVEMAGVAGSTVVLAFVSRLISWRLILFFALICAAVGNTASAFAPDQGIMTLSRILTGIGEGAVIGLSFTIVGLTTRTERNLALYLVCLLTYGALGLWAMPLVFDTIGLDGVFIGWAVLSLLALALVPAVPVSDKTGKGVELDSVRRAPVIILCVALFGILLYNIAIGVAWANLFLIGMDVRPDEQAIANALLIAQFVAVLGALVSVFLSERLGIWFPLTLGVLGGAAAIVPLVGVTSYLVFAICVSVFNFLWNMVLPFILGAVADLDARGRMVTPAIAMQMTGLGFGPFVAARLLGEGTGYEAIEWFTIIFLTISFLLLAFVIWFERKSRSAGEA